MNFYVFFDEIIQQEAVSVLLIKNRVIADQTGIEEQREFDETILTESMTTFESSRTANHLQAYWTYEVFGGVTD